MLKYRYYRAFKEDLKYVYKKIKKTARLFKETKNDPNNARLYMEFRTSAESFMDDELWASFAGPVPGYKTLKHDYNYGLTKLDLLAFDAKLKLQGINVKKMYEYRNPKFEDKINMHYAGTPFFRVKKGWTLEGNDIKKVEVTKEKTETETKDIKAETKNNTKTNEINKKIEKPKVDNIKDDEDLEME